MGCNPSDTSGPTAAKTEPADDGRQLQGTWKLVSATWNGEPQAGNMQWVVEGDHYTIRLDGQQHVDPHFFKLDAGQKRIDVFHHETPKGTTGGSLKGIYEIKGDRLRVSYDPTARRYPGSFESSPGSKLISYEFRREHP